LLASVQFGAARSFKSVGNGPNLPLFRGVDFLMVELKSIFKVERCMP
jgi:hypothetical protein